MKYILTASASIAISALFMGINQSNRDADNAERRVAIEISLQQRIAVLEEKVIFLQDQLSRRDIASK